MIHSIFSLLLIIPCCIFAGEVSFTCTSESRGNIDFSGKEMILNLHFRNNGRFHGKCKEILRIADFSGNSKIPEIREIYLSGNGEIRRTVEIPADQRGCFNIIYSLIQNDRILYQKVVPCAKMSVIKPIDAQGSPIGMYCHVPQWNGEKDFPVLKNMGITWVRTDFQWNVCQPKRGVWKWEQMDACMKAVRKYGMNITFNLLYAPEWAVRTRNLYGGTPADFLDFAEFAARACARYPDVIYWSIWNEPDAESHWDGGGKAYAELLKTTVPAMKKANPKVKILPGGVTGLLQLAAPFMREVGKHGGGDYFDVYDFHYTGLETHKKIAGEMGWGKTFWNTELSGGRGERIHLMPRETIAGMAHGLEKVFLFLCSIKIRNQDNETEFGHVRMLDNYGCPTFNFPVLYTLSSHLNGITHTEDKSAGSLRAFLLSGHGRQIWACWKNGNPRGTFAVRTRQPLKITLVNGFSRTLTPVNGQVFVPADDTVYLKGAKDTVVPLETAGMASLLPLKESPVYGKKLQIFAEVRNPFNQPFSGTLKLSVSDDWTQGKTEDIIRLAPGEKRKIVFTVTPRTLPDWSESCLLLTLRQGNGTVCGFDRLPVKLVPPLKFTLSPAFQWGRKKVQASVENCTASGIKAEMCFRVGNKEKTMPFDAAPMTVTRVYFTPEIDCESLDIEAVLRVPGSEARKTAKIAWHAIPSRERLGNKQNIVLKKRSDVISASNILYEWSGEKDLSAAASLCWVPEYVILKAAVTDDVSTQAATPGTLWTRDSLQVYFNGSVYDFGFCNGKAVSFCNGNEIVTPKYSITRKGNVTTYFIAFPKPGGGQWHVNDTLAIAFIINDADKNKRKGYLFYRNDIGDPIKRKHTEFSTLTE